MENVDLLDYDDTRQKINFHIQNLMKQSMKNQEVEACIPRKIMLWKEVEIERAKSYLERFQ